LDQGLYLSKRWSPNGGYFLSTFSTHAKNQDLENILLLKLHGSVNFRTPTQEVIEQYKEISDQFVQIEITNQIFPDIHSCINSRESANQPYILAMSYLKIYISGIMQLWDKAIEELKKADTLTIIGCSFREEDTFLRFMMRHFGEKENTGDNAGNFIIEIIDPNELIWEKLENELIGKGLVGHPGKQTVKSFKSLCEYLQT
jgi:hypothetical protein